MCHDVMDLHFKSTKLALFLIYHHYFDFKKQLKYLFNLDQN
jgi:hypothetical protein